MRMSTIGDMVVMLPVASFDYDRMINNIEEVIVELLPHAMVLGFWDRENAWHGHTSYEGPRRALQLNWVVDDAAARKPERRHGLFAFSKGLNFQSLFLAIRQIADVGEASQLLI